MLKLTFAILALVLMGGAVRAVEASDADQAVVGLVIYDSECAPVADALKAANQMLLNAMTDREKMRAWMVVQEQKSMMGKINFCSSLKPTIDKLNTVWK